MLLADRAAVLGAYGATGSRAATSRAGSASERPGEEVAGAGGARQPARALARGLRAPGRRPGPPPGSSPGSAATHANA